MSGLKRLIYGLPILAPYRSWRIRNLSHAFRKHHLGFDFAGSKSFYLEDWEVEERAVFAQEFSKDPVFIDIGANQGVYTCWAASIGLEVIAIEPESGNLRFLMSNVDRNDLKVEIYPVAVSDSISILEIYGDGDTASLTAGWANNKSSFSQLVPCNRIDNLFDGRWRDRRLLVKLDVEGHELESLTGAQMLIERPYPTVWIIENFPRLYSANRDANPGFLKIFEIMMNAGYDVRQVGTNREITKQDIRSWHDSLPGEDFGSFSFIFAKEVIHRL